jgi:hypothetical protein
VTPHSPTPWAVNYAHPDVWLESESEENNLADVHGASFEESKANAAYIVRCVNAHEALVDALKAVLNVLAPVINDVHDIRLADASDDPRIIWPDLAVLEQVEAALAAAGDV